jgi:lipopolysaccharide cholinephosphotransferase
LIQLSADELRRLKLIELDILTDVDRVCKENNIEYTLAWGTLIGAVRHNGFIPWDDDIDIMMKRGDYEKFMEIADAKLKPDLFLVNYKKYKGYALPFAKVMAKNTVMLEQSITNADVPSGVFIDIFPVDNTLADGDMNVRQYDTAQKIKGLLFRKCNYCFDKKGIKNLIWNIQRAFLVIVPKNKIINWYEKNATKFNSCEDTKFLMSMGGNSGAKKSTFPVETFKKVIPWSFEDRKFDIVEGYDDCLKISYGNYMSLPPKEQQVAHHFVEKFEIDKYKL